MSYNSDLQSNNEELQDILKSINELPDAVTDAVRYSAQSLNEAQKDQARQNIGALGSDDLSDAVDTALAQAKASGEFDGQPGADGKDGVSATHSWSGTVLTVTSASGTSSANLKGDKGEPGEKGADGAKGEKGDKGDTGLAGYTPVKGTDYWTAADKSAMVSDVLAALPTWNGGSY